MGGSFALPHYLRSNKPSYSIGSICPINVLLCAGKLSSHQGPYLTVLLEHDRKGYIHNLPDLLSVEGNIEVTDRGWGVSFIN